MSKESSINLENYNYNSKGPNLNSPFSKKALESLGIEEKELKTLSLDEYIKLNRDCKEISDELKKERYDNYLLKHRELINKAKEKRKELKSENEIQLNTEGNTENKIYHCELHKNPLSSNTFPKIKSNPKCEICNEYSKKYEKLKERMKISIQLEIDHEYDKKEKRKKQIDKHKKFENMEDKYKNNKIKELQNKKEKELLLQNEGKRKQEELRISMESKRREKEEKDKKGQKVKRNMEMLTEEKMLKLRNKQKEIE